MGAYKQFLTSDVITTPLKVNKEFTFQGSSSLNSASISRFLGQNVYQFDFNPKIDPYTGNYTIVTTGTTSSAQFNFLNLHSQASTVGSSSFTINDTLFIITGSNNLLPNGYNFIFVPSGSTGNGTGINIVNYINSSASFYSGLFNITSSRTSPLINLYTTTTGYMNNYNYVASGSTISYFSSGSNDIISGPYQYQRLVYDSIKQLYYSN